MPKSITFNVCCPACKNSLMDKNKLLHGKPSIRLNIVGNSRNGTMLLCSVYDCYDHQVNIPVKDQDIISFYCPNCMQNLSVETTCDICEAPMVQFLLDIGGKVNICSRKACKNHNVSFVDLTSALNALYNKLKTNPTSKK